MASRMPRPAPSREAATLPAMIDLYDELRAVAGALERAGVPYALIGALAVAVYATPRATGDVDLLVPGPDLAAALRAAEGLGYRTAREPMPIAGGRLRIQRVIRIVGEDVAVVDLMLADDAATHAMLDRRVRAGEGESALWVVAVSDLRALKRLRGSAQDLADLEALDRAQGGEP